MKVEQSNKRPLEFDKIRVGTVFVCNNRNYIKACNNDTTFAVDIEKGTIIDPTVDFESCYIYPGAVIRLNGGSVPFK